jgi:NTE family protein
MKKYFFVLITFASLVARGQEQRIRNLVFEGAGIRGIAYSGAIRELEKQNVLQEVKRVGGTSAGAITALMLSLGYTSDEITRIINSTSFKKFNDGKFFFIGGLNRLQKFYGWYRGQQIEKWISGLIETKTGNADINFLQLQQAGYKELYVTGTCLNRQSLVVFSHETYPFMKVRDAVRISMSIPLYFEAVIIDGEGKVIHDQKQGQPVDIMVDGGFIANFPIKIFDSTRYFDPSIPNQFAINPQTIGFRIDRHEQIINDQDEKGLAEIPIHNFKEYVSAFYNIILESLNRQTLTREDWRRSISISDGNIGPRIRKLSDGEMHTLVNNGISAAKEFSARRGKLE